MIYRVFIGFDTGGKPVYYKWHCDCEECLTTTASPCQAVIDANEVEKNKPQDNALYATLRR